MRMQKRDAVKQELRVMVKDNEKKTKEFEETWQNRGQDLQVGTSHQVHLFLPLLSAYLFIYYHHPWFTRAYMLPSSGRAIQTGQGGRSHQRSCGWRCASGSTQPLGWAEHALQPAEQKVVLCFDQGHLGDCLFAFFVACLLVTLVGMAE